MSSQKKNAGILLQSGTNEVEFLEFSLNFQTYGINVSKIRQVIVFEPSKVVFLPNSPKSVIGNICFRGSPVPVIDFREFFNLGPCPPETRRLLLVSEFNQVVVSFLVDSVHKIRRCSWESFRPSDADAFGNAEASTVGTIVENDKMMPILDVEAILSTIIPSASVSSRSEIVPTEFKDKRKNAQIIYCEDSKMVQKVLLKSLSENGFPHVKIFATGTEGLEYVEKARPGDIDIIISDIEMPQMDGLTLCKKVKEIEKFNKVPFLFFSSTVSDEMRRKCKSVGGTDAYSKPEITELIEALDLLLK